MTKLSVKEQRKLVWLLPDSQIQFIRSHCYRCELRGEAFTDIIKSVKKILSSTVLKALGPTVLKEFVSSFLKHKTIDVSKSVTFVTKWLKI